jgi:hypothetical protein
MKLTGTRPVLLLVMSLVFNLTAGSMQAQKPQPKPNEIIENAIQALGGQKFLGVRTVIGRGQYTQFKDGISGVPAGFIDYIAYPDKERTEFKGTGMRSIQTNMGETGWIFDGVAKTLRDMSPEGVKEFKRSMRTSVENFLRGAWRAEGATIAYLGRREAGLAKRNEVLRLTYPDAYSVEFEFGAQDHLPFKVIYKRTNADGIEIIEEDRLAQHISVDGILTPFVIDHFSGGAQTSRINYESVEFNTKLDDSLFTKPASAKAVK